MDARRLAENAKNLRGRQRENSADGYISAALIDRDYGRDEEDFHQYLSSGLTAVADLVLDNQSPEAARDLYAQALAVADKSVAPEALPDFRLALLRFFGTVDGRRTLQPGRSRDRDDDALREVLGRMLTERAAGDERLFQLVDQLVALTIHAADVVMDAIENHQTLAERAAARVAKALANGGNPAPIENLRRDWERLGVDWANRQKGLVRSLHNLSQIEISEDTLTRWLGDLQTLEGMDAATDREVLACIGSALKELRAYALGRAFEDREHSLRLAMEHVEDAAKQIFRAPTNFAVEALDPVVLRLKALIEQHDKQLLVDQIPQPVLSLALEQSSHDQHAVYNVQIKVANQPGAAPLESPELIIEPDDRVFHMDSPSAHLPTVRGGAHFISVARITVTQDTQRSGAFSLPLTLRYRSRRAQRYDEVSANLSVQLAPAEGFAPIDNPFLDGQTGRPVKSSAMFYGRGELLDRICARLTTASGPGTGIAIFGQKRAGKSSIRLHLTNRLRMDPGQFLVADLDNIGTLTPSPTETSAPPLIAAFLWTVLQRIHEALRKYHGSTLLHAWPNDLTRKEFVREDQPVQRFVQVLEDFWDRVRTDGCSVPALVVLIDEFQYFDEWIRTGALHPSFMQSLKALIERRLFHLVLVGQDALERLIAENANVFGVFSKERVTYLEPEHAALLADEPIREGGKTGISRYREKAIDRILELTGGSAFYVQRFCYHLVEHMNAQHARLVTEADVELVRDRLIRTMREEDFDNLETAGYTHEGAFTAPDYRAVLSAVALASNDGRCGYDAIAARYTGQADLSSVLEDLVIRDVVRMQAGLYSIVVRIYEEWTIQRHLRVRAQPVPSTR